MQFIVIAYDCYDFQTNGYTYRVAIGVDGSNYIHFLDQAQVNVGNRTEVDMLLSSKFHEWLKQKDTADWGFCCTNCPSVCGELE